MTLKTSNRTAAKIQDARLAELREQAPMTEQAQAAPKKFMLQKAHETIYGDRQQEYGPAGENFQNVADMWSVVLKTEVTKEQVALCMMQVKIARLMNTPDHFDSWMDIAGYAGCKEKMDNGV